MKNNWQNNGFKKAVENEKRNNNGADPLLEAEEKIKQAKYQPEPASDNFQQSLKAKILEERRKSKHMKMPKLSSFFSAIKPVSLTPALVFVLILAIILTSLHFWPAGPDQTPFKKISGLLISPAHAHDNFEIEATAADSLGVESNTSFIIKSKEVLNPDLLLEHISLNPDAEFDFEKINDHEFSVKPKGDLNPKTVYNVEIAAAYINENGIKIARDYSWAFQVKDTFKIMKTLPRNEAANVPQNTGIEVMFSHEDFENFEKAFSISPKVDGRFEKHKRTMVFIPKGLQKGTVYKVKIDKDKLKVKNSDVKLEKDYVFEFETAAQKTERGKYSNFYFAEDYQEFSTDQNAALKVSSYNVNQKTFPVTIFSFKNADQYIDALQAKYRIPAWAKYNRSAYKYDTGKLQKAAEFEIEPQKYKYNDFLVLPKSMPKGFYLAQTEYNGNIIQTYFQISDLAAYVNQTQTKTLIWVNNLKTEKPTSAAQIIFPGSDLKIETNDKGAAEFDSSRLNIDENIYQYFVKIKSADNIAVLPLRQNDDEKNSQNKYWTYVYTDKTMYRPSDTVNFWGFVKLRNGERINEKVKAEFSSGSYLNYYNENISISETEVDISDDGFFSGQIEFADMVPGFYNLTFKLGDEIFYREYPVIRDYTKPAYQLEITPDKKAVFADENISGKIKASFFDKTPVPNLDLVLEMDKKTLNITTDELGEASFSEPAEAVMQRGNHVYIQVRPKNPEQGEISDSVRCRVFNSKLSLKADFEQLDENTAEINAKTHKIDLSKINQGEEPLYGDYQGAPAQNVKIKAEVWEISYEKKEIGEYYDFINKIVRKQYKYERKQNKIKEYEAHTDKNGEYKNKIQIDAHKTYKVILTAHDSNGKTAETSRYLYSTKGVFESDYNSTYSLRFINPKEESGWKENEYKIGEQVELEFLRGDYRLPDNENKFLYFQMQQGLLDYEISGRADYSFAFGEKHVPNVYIRGVYFDGRTYHETYASWFIGDTLNAKYDTEQRELKIDVAADKKRYKPGEEVALNVKVLDKNNKPVKTNLNINLVDEAYYKLADDKIDILGDLYENISPGYIFTYHTHRSVHVSPGAEGGGCFARGTKILMADRTEKNIENVKKGDFILTFENEKSRKLVRAKVIQTFEHLVPEYMLINNTLKVTPEHRVFVNNGWQMIGRAKVGDVLIDENGGQIVIENIKRIKKYTKVYNLHVEKYHTYIADGLYVHNDKGGARQDFVDVALFFSTETDSRGQAKVNFELPDNITSWRINTQAISEDLFAGADITNIEVSLPVFVNTSLADQYLSADKPDIKMTAYGTALNFKDKAEFTVDAESLGIDERKKTGQAFIPVYYDFDRLTEGEHEIYFGLETKVGEDAVKKQISVVSSRLKQGDSEFYELKPGLEPAGGQDSMTSLVFSDLGQGTFYHKLWQLGWTAGDRIDQILSRKLSKELRKKYFDDKIYITEEFDPSIYQLPSGAVSLLPYSDADFELTAKAANAAPEYFDTENMAGYFYDIVKNDESTQEEVGIALFGLASLNKPVLYPLQKYAEIKDLTVKEKLYAALALKQLGDKERAWQLYQQIMKENKEDLDNYIRLNIGQDQDDVLKHTSLAAILAGSLNDANHAKLWNYVKENHTKDILINLEELMYIRQTLPELRPGQVSFTVKIDNKEINQTLEKGGTFQISLTKKQLDSIEFKNINGNIGLTSYYEKPADLSQVSSEVKLRREYYVNGRKTNTFRQDDLVEIRLYPEFSAKSFGRIYQVSDILPSGLKIVTNPYQRTKDYRCGVYYPYQINGQTNKFRISKEVNFSYCNKPYFTYYARVAGPGEYAAEPAQIRAFKNAAEKNYSDSAKIIIER